MLASLAAFVLLAAPALHAQEFRLFEPVESTGQNALPGEPQVDQALQAAMPSAPAFTLVGTSRIGGKQRATLASSNGQIVHVDITDAGDQPIDGHPGYRLVEIGSRRASIALPAGMPCLGSQSQGVSCGADDLVHLTLTTAAPMAAAVQPVPVQGQEEAVQANENGDVAPDNPFAAALRAAAQNEQAGQVQGGRGPFSGERFQPRRIAPEDVPPGMRVVRTPFGDRLVEL
jgi:hypothetical protein